MENKENIKKTNKALIVSNVILGCLLIIAMAFLAISIVNGNNVTASAAEESKYEKGELIYENTNNTPMEITERSEGWVKYEYVYAENTTHYGHQAYIINFIESGNEVEVPVFQLSPSENTNAGIA